jgi:Flp pilus assembly pilin Flp
VGFIAIIIVAGVALFGDALNTYFDGLGTWLGTVI